MVDPLSKKKVGSEESLFAELPADQRPADVPSPTEVRRKREQKRRREAARTEVRTKDEHSMSAHDLLTEWLGHLRSQGISETDLPEEIKGRVGRTLRSLISKGYLYDEIVFAMRTWTIRDLRNRQFMPRTGMIEAYARQFRGESRDEAAAAQEEHERLRAEALSQGLAPQTGTARQRQRDATMQAILRSQHGSAPGIGNGNGQQELEQ